MKPTDYTTTFPDCYPYQVRVGDTVVYPGPPTRCTPNEVMPVGNLAGWRQIFADDFNEYNVASGNFGLPGAVSNWSPYPLSWLSTQNRGRYSPRDTLSVNNGMLHAQAFTAAGAKPYATAVQPAVMGKAIYQTYGRYAYRLRTTDMEGFKFVALLWANDAIVKWPAGGEVNFPEYNARPSKASGIRAIGGFNHYADPAGGQDQMTSVAVDWREFQTYVIEWSPGLVQFYLNGILVGVFVKKTPGVAPMRLVFQLEPEIGATAITPDPSTVGQLDIDWCAIWAYDPYLTGEY